MNIVSKTGYARAERLQLPKVRSLLLQLI